MSIGLLAFLAFIPILIALILMAGMRWPSTRAMPIAWLAGVVLAFAFWGQEPLRLVALSIEGTITAVGVLIIVFGALLIYYTMQYSGAIGDFRVQYRDMGDTLEDIIVKVERRPLDESAII